MNAAIDHTNLHRTAKYFMDSGRAQTHGDAMAILKKFGLTIDAGPELAHSRPHQIALLTLVNLARRTFLGGAEITNLPDAPLLIPLTQAATLVEAVNRLGGVPVGHANSDWPAAMIGSGAREAAESGAGWQLTWQGWRGGVTPARNRQRLAEDSANPIAPALAAAACCAELFAWHAKDHPMAGRRTSGLSLWNPGTNWLENDGDEPQLKYLPSSLWLIGLGNLGQAFSWLLACLPYADRSKVELVLQDFDCIAESNDSTSVLSSLDIVGQKKTRAMSQWLETIGFSTTLEERRFGPWTLRGPHDPGVALCGVDNGLARSALEKSGFDLVVEAGLGAGPDGFRNFSMHTFPSSLSAAKIWSRPSEIKTADVSTMPAYDALRRAGLDTCGLAQLASRTVGVPFVGLIAAALAVAEPIRRLHGGNALELVSGSAFSLEDIEAAHMNFVPFVSGHVSSA